MAQTAVLVVLARQAPLQPLVALEPTTPTCRTTQLLEPLVQAEGLAPPQAPLELKHLALLAQALRGGLAVAVLVDSLPLVLLVRSALHQTAALAQVAVEHLRGAHITCAARLLQLVELGVQALQTMAAAVVLAVMPLFSSIHPLSSTHQSSL